MGAELPYISFLTEDQQQGGLWPESDKGVGTIIDLHYEQGTVFGRNGMYKTQKPTTMAIILIQPQGGGDVHEEITSVGDASRIIPSPDRDRLVPAPGATASGLAGGSNWALAMSYLENQVGKEFVRAVAMSAKSSVVGKVFEFIRVPQPERKNLTKVNIPGQQANDRKGTILFINKVMDSAGMNNPVVTPTQAHAHAPQAFAAPAPQAQNLVVVAGLDVAAETGNILVQIAAENPAGVAVAQLPQLVSAKCPPGIDAKTKGDILRKSLDPAFLKTQAGWRFEGGRISL